MIIKDLRRNKKMQLHTLLTKSSGKLPYWAGLFYRIEDWFVDGF